MTRDLSRWTPRQRPTVDGLRGRHVAIEGFDRNAHEKLLWAALGGPETNKLLFHFGWPPMDEAADLGAIVAEMNAGGQFVTGMFVDPATDTVMGMASYMRIDVKNGVCEVGCVAHGNAMARSRASTEAHYLLARRIFEELGYRRYEWKLNNANEPSHRAARRLGFTFEGVFRQLEVKPYGNRDTAWYALLDREWPTVRRSIEIWLDDSNFDADGMQKRSLESVRASILNGGR